MRIEPEAAMPVHGSGEAREKARSPGVWRFAAHLVFGREFGIVFLFTVILAAAIEQERSERRQKIKSGSVVKRNLLWR